MTAIFFDSPAHDDDRRERLYQGELYVYSPRTATSALCEFAREMCEEAFAPYAPTEAQHQMELDAYVAVLTELKPRFIHHPRCKEIIRDILAEANCDLDRTYFDVPRLRTSTSDDYLTSGIAYAFKPHRDTWYSPPMCQLNWWLPVYPITSDNGMAFHLHYWDRPIENSSDEFNYQDWVGGSRTNAAQHVKKDTRRQSEALEPLELEPDVRLITEPGGMVVFPAAHLHSSIPNTSGKTRISIDFRTVHLDDLKADHGAPNLDCRCTGTTIGDYLRGSDFAHVPEEVAEQYRESTAPVGV